MSDKSKSADHLKAYRFPKGVSGNSGGRPKGYERRLRDVIDSMTAADPQLAKDPTDANALIPAWEAVVKQAVIDAVAGDRYARDFIADRLMGKPKQVVVFNDEEPDPAEDAAIEGLSTDELRILAKVRTAAAPQEPPQEPDGVH